MAQGKAFDGKWDERQLALMRWLCLPTHEEITGKRKRTGEEYKGLRNPPTLTELAKMLGVTRDTLLDWQALPGFKIAQQDMAQVVLLEMTPRILRNLQAAALNSQNDRIFQVLFRYVMPAAKRNLDDGKLAHILPESANLVRENSHTFTVDADKFNLLPVVDQQRFYELYQQIMPGQDETSIVPAGRTQYAVETPDVGTIEVDEPVEAEVSKASGRSVSL